MAGPPKETADPASGAASPGNEADVDALLRDAARANEPPPGESPGMNEAEIDAILNAAAQGVPAGPASPSFAAALDDDRDAEAIAVSTDKFEFPEFARRGIDGVDARRLSMLNDVKLRVRVELGRTRMLVEDVLQLGEGSVVELDKLAGDPVDVYANDRLVARGEVLVLNDSFCVRICEVVSNDPHRVSL